MHAKNHGKANDDFFFLFPFLSFPSPTVVVVGGGGGGGSVSLLYVVIRCI